MTNKNTTIKHAEVIQHSWKRCRHYGLDHNHQPELVQLSKTDTANIREQYQSLINTTNNKVLPYYEHILSNSQCVILLANSQGQILKRWGDKRFITQKHSPFFEQGVDWKERTHGTNAIGTALKTGHAVQIQRDEHFLTTHRFMVGSAAPIYSVTQDILGVLDISSDTYLPQAHTLGMVKLISQSIENQLIIKKYSNKNYLLTFNSNRDNIDSQWSGLIVFNESGTIIYVNRRAQQLLNNTITPANISDIFDLSVQELKSHCQSPALLLPALGKYQMHGVINGPNQQQCQTPSYLPQHSSSTKPANTIIPLDRLGFGDDTVNRCIEQTRCVIEKDIPILILGETGVGKDILVKALHQYSSRRQCPLVPINCAAIPTELVESELFGYEKGAFTGANNKGSIGLIRKAHKGILFLDEIGEMPFNMQARLLRVLQERKVTPVGSVTSYPVDIKLISATNCCLKKHIDQKLFRQDLYYRISGLNITLPALRHRTDKRALFLEIHRLQHEAQHAKTTLSDDILNLFMRHPWPGNIRQLVSVIQIALAMADQQTIQLQHLPDDFFAEIKNDKPTKMPQLLAPASPIAGSSFYTASTPKKNHSDFSLTKQQVLQAYHQHQGNISRSARDLGISRNTLYKRLRELGIR